ncbi:hypothetical protein BC833DRAFT_649318 [Globomyces pollinis-pini]|nr:hypothetical protein BC833DRAFT_649318 [Globomyces pollinis-pini]
MDTVDQNQPQVVDKTATLNAEPEKDLKKNRFSFPSFKLEKPKSNVKFPFFAPKTDAKETTEAADVAKDETAEQVKDETVEVAEVAKAAEPTTETAQKKKGIFSFLSKPTEPHAAESEPVVVEEEVKSDAPAEVPVSPSHKRFSFKGFFQKVSTDKKVEENPAVTETEKAEGEATESTPVEPEAVVAADPVVAVEETEVTAEVEKSSEEPKDQEVVEATSPLKTFNIKRFFTTKKADNSEVKPEEQVKDAEADVTEEETKADDVVVETPASPSNKRFTFKGFFGKKATETTEQPEQPEATENVEVEASTEQAIETEETKTEEVAEKPVRKSFTLGRLFSHKSETPKSEAAPEETDKAIKKRFSLFNFHRSNEEATTDSEVKEVVAEVVEEATDATKPTDTAVAVETAEVVEPSTDATTEVPSPTKKPFTLPRFLTKTKTTESSEESKDVKKRFSLNFKFNKNASDSKTEAEEVKDEDKTVAVETEVVDEKKEEEKKEEEKEVEVKADVEEKEVPKVAEVVSA